MESKITGQREIENNLIRIDKNVLSQIVEAVEMTCVDLANHAKTGHDGNMAHANSRYQNRTTNLTNSIQPQNAEVKGKFVIGKVVANQNYAHWVEFGTSINVKTGRPNRPYPFMVPAMFASVDSFRKRMSDIL